MRGLLVKGNSDLANTTTHKMYGSFDAVDEEGKEHLSSFLTQMNQQKRIIIDHSSLKGLPKIPTKK